MDVLTSIRTAIRPIVGPFGAGLAGRPPPLSLDVVIWVIGYPHDVQPFVALGEVPQEIYDHRVRLAAPGTSKSFIEDNGLEFLNIGGGPTTINGLHGVEAGFMPEIDTLKNGDVRKMRKGMDEIM